MTQDKSPSRRHAGSHRMLRVLVEAAAAAAAIACFATLATLFVEHPERLLGAPEAVAAAAMTETEPTDEGAAPPQERESDVLPGDASEAAPAEGGLMTVAGALVDPGVDDTSMAAAFAALAVEMASNTL